MAILINDIILPLSHKKEDAFEIAIKKSKVSKENIKKIYIRKKAVDARDGNIKFVYSVAMDLFSYDKVKNNSQVKEIEDFEFKINCNKALADRPIIVGLGPAGLFCAYLITLYGGKPIVLEQGKPLEERKKDVELFFKKGIFNELSNVQFGEGGAGTFSDGKLTTRINDKRCKFVLDTFYKFGADESILYEAHPHIGTDCLGDIIKNMRKFIEENGGDVYFNSEVTDIMINGSDVKGVVLANGEKIFSQSVVLAVGHSSRKIFSILKNKQIAMEKKPFSVGFRIEHSREFIDKGRYGKFAGHKNLGSAEYQFSYRKNDRGCYTFCMCPGGQVIASNSERNSVVTNGMSNSKRDGINSNSAVVASVLPNDLDSDIFSGVEFQKILEKKAFECGGGGYTAPSQLSIDFLSGKKSTEFKSVKPTYPLGTQFVDFNEIFPQNINAMLKEGLINFDKKIKGFSSSDAVLTGIETRTSSPIRILRGENFNSISVKGLYPTGEGAGYAGGITSAAVDGLRIAQAILEKEGE